MRPLRLALNVAGLVLFPAFAAGALTFAAIDHVARRLAERHAGIDAELAALLAQPLETP